MKDLEIFDKNGKALHIADVVIRFIVDKAEQHKVGVNEIFVSTYNGKILIDQLESSGNANYFNELEDIDLNGL
ncbi:MAG: hypothetical protein ABIJ40_03600 [Bacteroidota bacterium]